MTYHLHRLAAIMLLLAPIGGCLAGAAIGAAGAVAGAAVGVTGAVAGAAVKTTGAVVDAALPDSQDEEEKDD